MSQPSASQKNRTCAITGANGYVGSRLADYLRGQGWQVREMRHGRISRDPERRDWIPFSLEQEVDPAGLQRVDLLIHCAYDFRPIRWDHIARVNVRGAERLFRSAREAGVSRIINVSSMSAFVGCKSLYGRAKLEIEELSRRFGSVSIRPGLVYGERPGGTVGALSRAVSASPLIPLVDDGRFPLHLVHEEDLCRLTCRIADLGAAGDGRPILAAADTPHSLRDILETLARQQGKKISFVRVPRSWLLAVLRAAEAVGVRAGFRSDSLISLVNQDPDPDFTRAREIGVPFREFELQS